MPINSISRNDRLLAALVLALGAWALSAGAAAAATIHACVKPKSGATRIVGAKTKCRHGEQKLSWSTTGPQGPAGAQGAQGAQGAPGSAGTNGSGPLFSGISAEQQTIAPTGTVVVSKVVPPGSYMIWAKTNLTATSNKREVEELSCELASRPGTTGAGELTLLDLSFATVELGETEPTHFESQLPVALQAAMTNTVTDTLVVRCFKPEGITATDVSFFARIEALGVTSIS